MKTKALISFAVNAKLICVFVFAYAKSRFCHDTAHLIELVIVSDIHVSESTIDILALEGHFSSGLELGFRLPG